MREADWRPSRRVHLSHSLVLTTSSAAKQNGRTTDRIPVKNGVSLSIEVLLDDGRLVMVAANRLALIAEGK